MSRRRRGRGRRRGGKRISRVFARRGGFRL